MSCRKFAAQKSCRWLSIISMTIAGLNAQTTSLTLSSATVTPDGTASLDLSLDSSSGVPPAAIQWTFQYSSSSISSIAVDDGPMSTSAGKTVFCAGDANGYTCLAVGLNAETIADGVVAKVTVVLAPGTSAATILVTGASGASPGGDPIPISAASGTITSAKVSPYRKAAFTAGMRGGRQQINGPSKRR